MRSIVRTTNFPLNREQIDFSHRLGISQDFLRLLLGRGMELNEIPSFLRPSIADLSSPYEIDGMKEAVERIRLAIARKERVLIYGDYDCDGICATSTLMLFFKNKLDSFYFIPNRHKDGYGISVEALERVLYNQSPTLVITVDCGITADKEVEYLKSRGIDVIVTDHHEPQDNIPNCIVVNPKVARKGFYDLCGAGVALKLVEALSSREEACKYLDIVSIATIADVVPLKRDNRIIAYYGLKMISEGSRKGLKMLLGEGKVSAQDVMFRLAPRMNAAGRLNTAMKVVGLFLEDDYFLLKTLVEELERDNHERQALCERVVAEAKSLLKGVDFAKTGLITLYSDNWESGVLGIACARLVEEFKRPAILFAKNGEELKGSARSVESVNIFELLSELSPLFTAFGGHAQAAGVSLNVDNFDEFKRLANEKILSTHKPSDFESVIHSEMALPINLNFLKFAKELEMLEPTGYQNPLPSFLIEGEDIRFESIGFSQHMKCQTQNIDLLGFSKYANSLYAKTGKIKCDVTLGINVFQNKQTPQGILRNVMFIDTKLNDEDAIWLNSHHLTHEGSTKVESVDIATLHEFLKEGFGTLIVCFDKNSYDTIAKDGVIGSLPISVADVNCLNPENQVVICPSRDFDFSFYKRVVLVGAPMSEGYVAHVVSNAMKVYSLGDVEVSRLSISDDTLRSIYKEILTVCSRTPKMASPHRMYVAVCSRYKVSESVFKIALKIFDELSLVKISDKGIVTISRKGVNLADSITYRNLKH